MQNDVPGIQELTLDEIECVSGGIIPVLVAGILIGMCVGVPVGVLIGKYA